jgi:hypothetical protein
MFVVVLNVSSAVYRSGQLEISATVAAKHEHGVDLRIPDDRSEISLGF